MGTLTSAPQRLENFNNDVHKKGLDLGRCKITNDLGVYRAAAAATWNPGSIVSRNTSSEVVAANLVDVFGVTKWGRGTFGVAVAVDVPITLNGTTATNLTVNGTGRGNVSNVQVRSVAGLTGGTLYTSAFDYTINAGNGTVARQGGGAIADGATVYVSFTYALVDADFDVDGRFWQNQAMDRTGFQDQRITVITGWSLLFTTEFQTGTSTGAAPAGNAITNTGVTSNLYCSSQGKFTTLSTNAEYVGKVYQVPTSTDYFLGVNATGVPVAAV